MSLQAWQLLRAAAVCLVALGLSGLVRAAVLHPNTGVAMQVRHYSERVGRKLAFLRIPLTGPQLLALQLGSLVTIVLLGLAVSPVLGAVLVPLPWAVEPVLGSRVDARLEALNNQLEGWLLALVAALSSGASLGQALEETLDLIEAPLRDEVRWACREVSVGVSVSDALQRMTQRVPSATLATAVAAIRVGQRTGGSLATLLKRAAETLREMARLEGVVRTRTAESRAQATVIGLLPLPVVALMYKVDPRMMAPLWQHPDGVWVIAAALILWLAAVFLARKVLHVDI